MKETSLFCVLAVVVAVARADTNIQTLVDLTANGVLQPADAWTVSPSGDAALCGGADYFTNTLHSTVNFQFAGALPFRYLHHRMCY